MRQQGRLTKWNDERGFGFITPSSGGKQVFVHISSFRRGQRRPMLNESVSYRVARDHQKRPRAEEVLVQRGGKAGVKQVRGVVAALALSTGFFAGLSGSALFGFVPLEVVALYAFASVTSFVMYGLDKAAAERGEWRTPEATLHLVTVVGGWPGALVAQRMFRHKTRKQPFQFFFWCTVAANCSALVWLLRSDAAAGLRGGLGLG